MHIPLQWSKLPYLPQPLCQMNVRSPFVGNAERQSYLKLWHFSNNRDTPCLSLPFIFSSLALSLLLLRFAFCVQWHMLLFFFLYFPFPPHTTVFSYVPIFMPRMLSHSIFHAGTGYPHCGELCFIWVWKQCANIACLYPLGGIMAAITHWCSTKTDILLSLCWQTTYNSHCCICLLSLHLYFSLWIRHTLWLSPFCHLSPCYSAFIHSSVSKAGIIH